MRSVVVTVEPAAYVYQFTTIRGMQGSWNTHEYETHTRAAKSEREAEDPRSDRAVAEVEHASPCGRAVLHTNRNPSHGKLKTSRIARAYFIYELQCTCNRPD